ncbi:P-loop containing nucleoside triphosphate hydrolase protein [Gonapodya prolifera JEL478]|uniref:Adenylate kinase isoenzyme 6 homolog n=1 Tax=Gonapodya prolifera (strain JEL478) TaxID=1344416 RepID=A0A139A286_GONPJ|nr:P-loop containing nucleoside triphosphate hydrolase protein [Gonapodya prolifera JEL478]|eukprot:KXS10809.1 P-loop containing nucleoside triphosphate hydrolase protein [Gonapodya prolifera JEL478]
MDDDFDLTADDTYPRADFAHANGSGSADPDEDDMDDSDDPARPLSTIPPAIISKFAISSSRRRPNILVTGTPGTGKSTTAELLALATNAQHIDVGRWVKERSLHDGWDEKWAAYVVDEDRVVDELEDKLAQGGVVVDYHGCDFFPERWFDLVVVLRTDNGTLYRRLEERNYPAHKLTENTTAEIMQVCLEEARGAYARSALCELRSDSSEDLDRNVEALAAWCEEWCEAAKEAQGGEDEE